MITNFYASLPALIDLQVMPQDSPAGRKSKSNLTRTTVKAAEAGERTLRPKDVEAIRRLVSAGYQVAAQKLYSGAMDCGMTEAAESIERMKKDWD